ncbi:MAG: PspA/IM30 family protein [Opitutales bacterium]
MSIFSRFRDIVSSNINSMLDKAEDPEKLLKLMVREMEDTLVELKSSCAGVIATQTKNARVLQEAESLRDRWQSRAQLAAEKGRSDLAREALIEKRNAGKRVSDLEAEQAELEGIIAQYKSDIHELESKIDQARKKHAVLVQRHRQANQRKQAQSGIRTYNNAESMAKFDDLESKIDRMEADADLVNTGKANLDDAFRKIETDDDLEKELEDLLNNNKK